MAFLLYLIVAILAVMASPMDVIPKAYFNRSELRTTLLFGDLDQSAYSSPSIWESFRNRRIAFLGDSVMRYQYHVLAYFLVHRQWPQAEDKLCNHAHFKSWVKFMEYETGLMKGFEISETYRNDKMCCGGWTVCDNRQLHIPSLNATIWYFLWFGNQSSPHGHFSISKGLKKLCKPGHCTEHASKHPWMLTPAEFTFKFISAHNPDFFFLNCGLHAYPFDAQYPWGVEQGLHFEKILKKLKLMPHITTRVFWRATTPHTDNLITINESVAVELAQKGVWELYNQSSLILNLATTHKNHRQFRTHQHPYRPFNWDAAHYSCWAYSEMNRDLAVRFLYKK